jgi:hypothetical protein
LTGSIPSEVLSLLDMTTLVLDNNKLTGTIPTEIGLLKKLTHLDLHENRLSGVIPSQIHELINLRYLNLNENDLTGYVNCSNFPQILNVGFCNTSNYFRRWDTESPSTSAAPTTSLAPSDAPTTSLAPSDAPSACRSIAEILCEEKEFEQMCALMGQVNATDILTIPDSTWTIFAPSAGFDRHYIDNGVKFNFKDLFLFHAVEDREIFKEDLPCIPGSNLIEMENGHDSRTVCDNQDIPIGQKGIGNNLPIPFVAFDMVACNGVIHTISDVLDYGYLHLLQVTP